MFKTKSRSDIREVSAGSFVGIEIDFVLSCKEQNQTINECIRKRVGILFKLRHFVHKNILVLLYNAFIQPRHSYGVGVFGNTYTSNLNCIYFINKWKCEQLHSLHLEQISFFLLSLVMLKSLNFKNFFCKLTFMYDFVKGELPYCLVDYCQMIQHRKGLTLSIKMLNNARTILYFVCRSKAVE